uniref:Reverse transcriptase Ty1/copia-type domain-containing protein n=1 Tax=Tanacetum cinerariifolium TaxID=118510 RepID=A0A699JE73_TANCI|nr:hypothetical protein [Tanacetum cinerariifolium]
MENKPNVAGSGPTWMFDIDSLSQTMNYHPVIAENQSNPNVGFQDTKKAGEEGTQTYVLFPVLSNGSINSQNNNKDALVDGKEHDDDIQKSVSPDFHSSSSGAQTRKQGDKTENKGKGKSPVVTITGFMDLNAEFKECNNNSNDVGAEADINNLESIISVSPILTTRIHKDHPSSQFIGDLSSTTQTKSMARAVRDQEPKRVHQALNDPSWIESMQEELLQFKMQKVWILVDLPYGKKAIEEEVYVCQPPGFEDPKNPDKVYKVVKALYGLHQALRAWYETLATYLLENRFHRGTIDQTLFIKKQQKDILLVSDELNGRTHFLLRSLEKPLLKDLDGEDVDVHTYRSMIGSLIYLTSSRPDIMFVVCACAQFQVTSKVSHLNAVKRIFRYLKGKPYLGLWYQNDSPFDLVAYSDSDYAGASLDRKSTTGGCQFLGCRLIFWQCKKQIVVATSLTKAEYVAAASGCAQVLWIQNQLLDYGLISWQCKKQTVIATFSIEAEYVAAASGCAQVLWIQNQLLDYGYKFMHTYLRNMVIEMVVLNLLSDALPIITNGTKLTMSNPQERVDSP